MVNKRFASILILVLLAMSPYASFGGGYSVYPIGERFGDESFGGAAIGGYISPTGLNNKGKVEADVLLSMVRPVFRGVNPRRLPIIVASTSSMDGPSAPYTPTRLITTPTSALRATRSYISTPSAAPPPDVSPPLCPISATPVRIAR